jgi:hypothetical protein
LQSEKVSGENNPMYGDKFYRSEEGYNRQRKAVLGEKNGSKSEVSRKKISESKLGKKRSPFSDDWIEKMSVKKRNENNPMFNKNHTDETKQKQREKAIGRKQSPETVAKKAEAIRGLKREKKLCPHCNNDVAVNGYVRWHGDNCKQKA